MSDRPQSIVPPPPIDWTDDGIYRSVFLSLFDPGQREILRQAGAILATQAVSGDTADRPVLDPLLAVSYDLRMCERTLLEIAAERHGSVLGDEEAELCRMAETWADEVGGRSHEIECRVREVEGDPEPEPDRTLGAEIREAERVAHRLAHLHPDPEARRVYGWIADRAAAKAKDTTS